MSSNYVGGNVNYSTSEATRHPKGLVTLASTELWERLSFYGLQVILA